MFSKFLKQFWTKINFYSIQYLKVAMYSWPKLYNLLDSVENFHSPVSVYESGVENTALDKQSTKIEDSSCISYTNFEVFFREENFHRRLE